MSTSNLRLPALLSPPGGPSPLDADALVAVDADEAEDPSYRVCRSSENQSTTDVVGDDEKRADPRRIEEGQLGEVQHELALRVQHGIHGTLERIDRGEVELTREPEDPFGIGPHGEVVHATPRSCAVSYMSHKAAGRANRSGGWVARGCGHEPSTLVASFDSVEWTQGGKPMSATQPGPMASPSTTTTAAARAVDLTKVYGEGDAAVRALAGVSVQFERGGFTAIMGPSGSGKSTLLHCMAGLDTPTSGNVFIGDVDLTTLSEKQLTLLRREKIGFVFQAYNLLPTLTAAENITLPLDIAGDKPDAAWFDTVVDTIGIRDRLTHRPNELSGGQQQRVAGARALLSKPEIVYADEPTGNLDSKSGHELLEFLRGAVNDHGQTIVMVTHDASAASFADRIVFLQDGRIVDEMPEPTTERVLDRLKSLES
jgi:putative ABC transport system ATP-binding protein